jgi:hypothetical protein
MGISDQILNIENVGKLAKLFYQNFVALSRAKLDCCAVCN